LQEKASIEPSAEEDRLKTSVCVFGANQVGKGALAIERGNALAPSIVFLPYLKN